jgi:hypothetical protein
MIESPGVLWRFHEDEMTRQQVRPGTARRVWPYLRRYRGPIALLVLITLVDSAIVVAIPLILRLIIDDGILPHRGSVVVALALTVAGLALVEAGAQYVGARYSDLIGESLVLELRTSVFRHVLRQPLAFFTRAQTGSLVSRLDDINETQRVVGGLVSESLSVLLNLAGRNSASPWPGCCSRLRRWSCSTRRPRTLTNCSPRAGYTRGCTGRSSLRRQRYRPRRGRRISSGWPGPPGRRR